MKYNKFPEGYFEKNGISYINKYGNNMRMLSNGEMVYWNNHGKRTQKKSYFNRQKLHIDIFKKDAIKYCKEVLTIYEIDNLIEQFIRIRKDKFNSQYKTVCIYPGNRIENKITKETGFECYHKPCEGYSMGRGTHVIVIPIEKYNEKLKDYLISKYDEN